MVGLGIVAVGPTPARADGTVLEWSRAGGAESCADEGTIRALVERTLGEPMPTAPAEAPGRIVRGRATRAARGWTIEIDVVEGGGLSRPARRIDSELTDCRRLDGSIALVVALLVRPTEESVRPVVETVPPETSPREAAATSAPFTAMISAGPTLAVGIVGDLAFGARIAVAIGLSVDDLALRVGVSAFPSRTVRVSVGAAEIDGWLGLVGLTGRVLRERWVWLEIGADLHAGVARAAGREVTVPVVVAEPLVIVGLVAAGTVWLHEMLGVRLETSLAIPVVRNQWLIASGATVTELASTADVGMLVALEAVLRLAL
jgi:hypothetical protein